jgi:hypothetical protein
MHLQLKGSPDDTASNVRRIVNALAKKGINIEAIAPDFDPPHVRLLVEHNDPYDPNNEDDAFNRAIAAMEEDGLAPEVKSGLMLNVPNKPAALMTVLQGLTREGYTVESILVYVAECTPESVAISFGVARTTIEGWDTESDELASRIQEKLDALS